MGEHSIVDEIANKSFSRLSNPAMPDRTQWLYDLAYKQWTTEEVATGEPFKFLKVPEVIIGQKICSLRERPCVNIFWLHRVAGVQFHFGL